MIRTKHTRFAPALIWLTGAVVALGLTACGGDDKKKDATPASTSSSKPPAATPSKSGGGGGGAGATKPGAELAVGETAHVVVDKLGSTGPHPKTWPIDATVLKLEKGSISDFRNVDLDPEQKSSTPYYASVRLEATKEAIPTKDNNDPDVRFDGIDDRKQEQSSVTFLGTFDRCVDKDPPKVLGPGDSYESCLTYLVPGGGSIEEIHWTGTSKYLSDPVVWK